MRMNVDEAWRDDATASVDGARRVSEVFADGDDLATLKADVRFKRRSARAVDHETTGDERIHGRRVAVGGPQVKGGEAVLHRVSPGRAPCDSALP